MEGSDGLRDIEQGRRLDRSFFRLRDRHPQGLDRAGKPGGEVCPQARNFVGGFRFPGELHDGASVGHAGGEVDTLPDEHRGNRPVARQQCDGFRRYLGPAEGGIDHKDERFAEMFDQFNRRHHRADVVRAWPRRDNDEIGKFDTGFDGIRYRRWGVDNEQFDSCLLQAAAIIGKIVKAGLYEKRRPVLPCIPPIRQACLRIGVDDRNGAGAGFFGGDGKVSRKCRFSRAALARHDCD